MTKNFQLGKWYRISKPKILEAPGVSLLKWSPDLDEFNGKIMQCTYCFFGNQHAFLGSNRSAGFHQDWVIGPYDTREHAQNALLNDAVKSIAPIIGRMGVIGYSGPKGATCPVGPQGTPYAVAHGRYLNEWNHQHATEAKMFAKLIDKNIQPSFVGQDKKTGAPRFYNTKNQQWDTMSIKPSAIDKAVQEVFDDLDIKKYVGEMIATVSKFADKETKKITGQLEAFKTELANAKSEREVLHARDELGAEHDHETHQVIAASVLDLQKRVSADFKNIQNVVNHNAKTGMQAHKLAHELSNGIVEATMGSLDDVSYQLDIVRGQIDEAKMIAKVEAEKTKEDLKWTSEAFKQELLILLKERREQDKTFRVGDTVYQIDEDQLWVFDSNKQLWTTVKPSSQLIGDAKMRAEMAAIDKKAEEDINGIYKAFHDRQKARKNADARNKKEFKKDGFVGAGLAHEAEAVDARMAPYLAGYIAPVVKVSLLKKAAKWAGYTFGMTSGAAAGIAAAVYLLPLMF